MKASARMDSRVLGNLSRETRVVIGKRGVDRLAMVAREVFEMFCGI